MPYIIFNFDQTSLCKQQPSIFLHFLNRGIEKIIGLVTEKVTLGSVIPSVLEDKIRVAACFNLIPPYKAVLSSNLVITFYNFFCKRRPLILRDFFDRNIINNIITDRSSLTFFFSQQPQTIKIITLCQL